MYTLFSRIALNDQNVKNALDYAEKYCCSFHLSLLMCKDIIDRHITFTDSVIDEYEMSVSDVIPTDDEELEVLVESLIKLDSMSSTYEKLHEIIDDLIKTYYDKTHDDTFIKMRESYRYMCTSDENHEALRKLYINEYSDMKLCVSVLMNSMGDDLETANNFYSEECLETLDEFMESHKDKVVRKELEHIMKSNLEDWKTIIREYM